MARALGIDHGDRRIGLALSDPTGTFASPLSVLDTHPKGRFQRRLEALLREHDVDTIVVGEPLTMRGEIGEQAEKVGSFIEWLQSWCDLPVVRVDERLTSVIADKALIEAGMRREKRRGKRDIVAAALILQSWLDSR